MLEQLKSIQPSVKGPLFRRLMHDESLAYLREDQNIIGFEVDLSVNQRLSGFALIAIQKHTIYAYCADINEEPKLILFPPLDKLFDSAFALLDLSVKKVRIVNETFKGKALDIGVFRELVHDLTPPEKEVDIPNAVSEQMVKQMNQTHQRDENIRQGNNEQKDESLVKMDTKSNIDDDIDSHDDMNNYDDMHNYDDFENYDDYEHDDMYNEPVYTENFQTDDTPLFMTESEDKTGAEDEPEIEVNDKAQEINNEVEQKKDSDERSLILRSVTFESLAEMSTFVHTRLGVSKEIATQVVNKALQSNVDTSYKIELATLLFEKLFDEKKI